MWVCFHDNSSSYRDNSYWILWEEQENCTKETDTNWEAVQTACQRWLYFHSWHSLTKFPSELLLCLGLLTYYDCIQCTESLMKSRLWPFALNVHVLRIHTCNVMCGILMLFTVEHSDCRNIIWYMELEQACKSAFSSEVRLCHKDLGSFQVGVVLLINYVRIALQNVVLCFLFCCLLVCWTVRNSWGKLWCGTGSVD